MSPKLITQNSKLLKTSRVTGFSVFNYGITAGPENCPFAGECAKWCYAKKGTYGWSNVKQAFDRRSELVRTDQFVPAVLNELDKKRKIDYLRVHDSGDYFDLPYIMKWFEIMRQRPDIQFYSYTKAVKLMKRLKKLGRLPNNFTVIYSFGGKFDHLIDTSKDRHALVFETDSAIDKAGYANASDNDLIALNDQNFRIGLRKH